MSPCSHLRFRAPVEKAVLLIVVAALSGCDVPTALPIFDVGLQLPVEESSISVVELLPPEVDTAGGNFDVTVDPVMLTETLGTLCPLCIDSGVVPVPKPAFIATFNQTGSLPTDVDSATVVGGSISLAIDNNLGFDPINPAPASFGTFTVTLFDTDINGDMLGQVMLDGANGDSLPAGPSTIPLPLTGGTIKTAVFAVVDVDSPVGDPVPIDLAASFDITATVVSFLVSSITVNVDGQVVTIDPTNPDVEDIDEDLRNRLKEGSLILDIQNPFGVGIPMMSLDISGPTFMTISDTVNISRAPTSRVTVLYTGDQLRTFLGQPNVLISGGGTVVSPGVPPPPITVTPDQVMVIQTSLDLVVEISSPEEPGGVTP